MQKEINHNLIIIFQTQEETSESKEEEITKLSEYQILEQTYGRVGSRILNWGMCVVLYVNTINL